MREFEDVQVMIEGECRKLVFVIVYMIDGVIVINWNGVIIFLNSLVLELLNVLCEIVLEMLIMSLLGF